MLVFREFREPFPLGSGFSCVLAEKPGERWSQEAIEGLVGQTTQVTTPSGVAGVYRIEWARRRGDDLIEITAVPVTKSVRAGAEQKA